MSIVIRDARTKRPRPANELPPYDLYSCEPNGACVLGSGDRKSLTTLEDCKTSCVSDDIGIETWDKAHEAVKQITDAFDNGADQVTAKTKIMYKSQVYETTWTVKNEDDDTYSFKTAGLWFDIIVEENNINVYEVDYFYGSGDLSTYSNQNVPPRPLLSFIDFFALGFSKEKQDINIYIDDQHFITRYTEQGIKFQIPTKFWLPLLRGYSFYENRGYVYDKDERNEFISDMLDEDPKLFEQARALFRKPFSDQEYKDAFDTDNINDISFLTVSTPDDSTLDSVEKYYTNVSPKETGRRIGGNFKFISILIKN